MKKEKVVNVISAIVFLYFIFCFVNVIMHNASDQLYSWWNIFSMLFR